MPRLLILAVRLALRERALELRVPRAAGEVAVRPVADGEGGVPDGVARRTSSVRRTSSRTSTLRRTSTLLRTSILRRTSIPHRQLLVLRRRMSTLHRPRSSAHITRGTREHDALPRVDADDALRQFQTPLQVARLREVHEPRHLVLHIHLPRHLVRDGHHRRRIPQVGRDMDAVTVRREAVAGDVERGPRSLLWPAESPIFRQNLKQCLDHASLLLKGDWLLHCRSGIGRAIQHIRHHRVPRVSDGGAVQAGGLHDGSQE